MLVYQSSIARTYSTPGNNVVFFFAGMTPHLWDHPPVLSIFDGPHWCQLSGHDPIPGPGKHLFVYIFGVGKSGRITMLVEPR